MSEATEQEAAGCGEPVTVEHRVIYGDTDAMGVVYYGNYLRFLEIGRCELLRARGRAYREIEATGLLFPVAEVRLKYLAPARYDDLIAITTRVAEVTRATVRFEYTLTRPADGTELTTGFTLHPCFDPELGRVVRLPKELVAVLRGEG